ncbi:MAG: gliding motility lipoprotein GldD [Bacteroidota bacterium]
MTSRKVYTGWVLSALGLVLVSTLAISTRRSTYLPKPFGYPRICLPEPSYQPLAEEFPYFFEFSKHAHLTKSTSCTAEPYWIDITYPAWGACIQLTYKPVHGDLARLREYLSDAYRLTSKHQIRAYAIEDKLVETDRGCRIIVSELLGEVPTPIQFYGTDSVNHFLRGALYFDTATENDYRAPIIAFIKADIMHMLHTLSWSSVPAPTLA